MPTNIASYTYSNPVVTQRSDSLDGGAASRTSTSGTFATFQGRIVNGVVVIEFDGVDQSQQPASITAALPAAILTALVNHIQAQHTIKLNALIAAGNAPAGTTVTVTAGP